MDAELIAYHEPGHPVSAQYRDLLEELTAGLPGGRALALLLTPALPETDAAAVLLNLAVTAARRQLGRVAVVDGGRRPGGVAKRLGLAEAPGLREVLSGAATLEQTLRPTAQEGLFALPAGGADAGSLLGVEAARSLVQQLRRQFALTLIQAPRWDGRPEAGPLGAACDAVCLVVPEEEANSPEVGALLQAIPEQGARLAGCILAG
jgi:Mrp family chromosome partitioning ATPase